MKAFPYTVTVIFLLASAISLCAQEASLPPQLQLSARVNYYDHNRFNLLVHQTATPLSAKAVEGRLSPPGSEWEVFLEMDTVGEHPEAVDLAATFRCIGGEAREASVSVGLTFSDWQEENYVLLPGAAYNGNRFTYRRIRYSPKLLDPRDIGPDVPTIISDVPKLAKGGGPSRIQQRTGDMTVPSAGFWEPEAKRGFWLLTKVGTALGDSGIDIEENRQRNKATISITAPVVRELYKYRITDNRWPSDDVPHHFRAGDEVTIRFRLHFFEAPELQHLFDYFTEIRKSYIDNGKHRLVLPFSSAFEVQEDKFNRLNWVPEYGYYSVGPRNMFLQDWQIGWTGGMISTFPLLWMGSDSTRRNVLRNFDWLFPDGIAPSGLFWDSGEKGHIWYGGDIRKPHTKNWHLIRKSGDGLYYILKQLMLMEKLGIESKAGWVEGTKGAADALVKIWEEYGQFGQFVDNPTGKVVVGGSTSGGIIPAALTLAADYFDESRYLKVAKEAAAYYYENYVNRGLTTGGPGDALQNPDSESSYALVESYAMLYEATGEERWLQMGEDMARQFATWVHAYNYPFPDSSLFGKEGMYSMGAVNANTQNKHGAPGICTQSGIALLRLFRATGDPFYAELLQDIARNMPQYLPTPQKPIEGAKAGWMCERVSTTDWLEGIGEISYLTTWSETALMLTYIEVPGLYVQPHRSFVLPFDNIEARLVKDEASFIEVEVHNPTKMKAEIKLLTENEGELQQPLGALPLWNARILKLEPGETEILRFKK